MTKIYLRQFPNMVLVITQETFDNAVQENIDDLGMEPQEAVQEAIIQFEKQVNAASIHCIYTNEKHVFFKGVDLSNIVKKLSLSEDKIESIKEALAALEKFNNSAPDSKEIGTQLEIIRAECDKGIEMKVAAGKKN